jgi:hypothetical protein
VDSDGNHGDKGEGLLREETNELQFMGWMMACSYYPQEEGGTGRGHRPVCSIIGAYKHIPGYTF